MVSRDTILRRVSSLPFQKLNDEVLVVDPRTRQVHLLNFTATRIWDLLEEALTADELMAALSDEFDAPAGALRVDVDNLLAELTAKGLVGADAVLGQHLEDREAAGGESGSAKPPATAEASGEMGGP